MPHDQLDKLRILLPHWIEHSHSHQAEFDKWQDVCKDQGAGEAAEQIDKALKAMKEADHALGHALELLGGAKEGHHHHHHH